MATPILPIVMILVMNLIIVSNDFLTEMECSDCSLLNEDCRIRSTGFYCPAVVDKLIPSNDSVGHLRMCMLPQYSFKDKELENMCCIWSPTRGCQMVFNKRHRQPCKICAAYKKKGMPPKKGCPCTLKYERNTYEMGGQVRLWSFSAPFLILVVCFIDLLSAI